MDGAGGVAGHGRPSVDATSGQIGADAAWFFALPEWLSPFTLHFQDWILDGGTFTSTQRLSVPIIK